MYLLHFVCCYSVQHLGRSPEEHFETGDNPCKMLLRHQLEQTNGYLMGVLEQGIQVAI